ncbi:MAG TPA: PHP domain-containing protein [Candidatus Cloacimonadota bacterium]|nr:PHP domain-containing protein [Candidatus Cloacimonadota bacterium]
MRWFTADLHIHSVLSPCGGLEMAPDDLIARLKELEINWFAITDHNSMANCPAYHAAAKTAGLEFSWGVELQTAEEIHLLVYFDDCDAALSFDQQLYAALPSLPNDPDFFGDQVVIDENCNIIRMEQKALSNSTRWDLSEAVSIASAHGGYCVPAHIDAGANSILGQLGFMPQEPDFELLGITARLDLSAFLDQHPELRHRAFLRCSDAHYLADLGSGTTRLKLERASLAELFKAVRGEPRTQIIV